MKNRLSDTRCEAFYAELHTLLHAGLDFSLAFELLAESENDRRMRTLLQQLYEGVLSGAALWQVMERSGSFRALDCGVVRIGEHTGRLAETLAFLRDYYRKQSAQRRMVSSATSYPLVILCTAVAVMSFMLTTVVPMFEQVYARMGGRLPALTCRIIGLSQALPASAAIGAVAIAALGGILYAGRERPEVRRAIAGTLLRLPVAGTIIRKNCQARSCKLLDLLLSAGVPLLTAVGLLRDVIGFHPYREAFARIQRDLEAGDSFAASVSRFPRLYDLRFVTFVRVGESAGRLAEMLRREGDTQTVELENAIRRLGTLLEPVMVILTGIFVAVILIAMYLPMFSLGGILG